MANKVKAILKQGFYKTGQVELLDNLLFRITYLKHWSRNRIFRKKNPDVALPPDYFLYETFLLDYEQYIKDGEIAADEIVEWVKPYIDQQHGKWNVMEWGCGVGRIIRHLHKYLPDGSAIHGCDINTEMIEWNQQHIKEGLFRTISYTPPMMYETASFDMVYAISVFTHIAAEQQADWIKEMHRIIRPGGVFLFTTHGTHYFHQLLAPEASLLKEKGVYTRSYARKGHRMMTTYNESNTLAQLLTDHFEVLQFFEGATHQHKVGGQDLWIVRRK